MTKNEKCNTEECKNEKCNTEECKITKDEKDYSEESSIKLIDQFDKKSIDELKEAFIGPHEMINKKKIHEFKDNAITYTKNLDKKKVAIASGVGAAVLGLAALTHSLLKNK